MGEIEEIPRLISFQDISSSSIVATINVTQELCQAMTDQELGRKLRVSYLLSSIASEIPHCRLAFALDDLVNFWSSATFTPLTQQAHLLNLEQRVAAATQLLPIEHSMITFFHERSISRGNNSLLLAQALTTVLRPYGREGWRYLNTHPQHLIVRVV